ncbi:hypothetical protein KBB06_04125 [Candidatus Gracilibacteria bacterium]|nr:hypothetical protein [Candidatus Gracilibacteria bacterium]
MEQASHSSISEDIESLQEKCGVIGIMSGSPDRLKQMAIVTLPSIEHRGADGTGCAYVGLESTVFHSAKPASVFAQKLQDKEIKQSGVAVLQSRYATSGNAEKPEELQPFLRYTPYGKIALAFNGNIWNWSRRDGETPSLKEQACQSGYTLPDGKPLCPEESTDTEAFFYLLKNADRTTFINALTKDVFPRLKGSYSLIISKERFCSPDTRGNSEQMIVARDPHGFHPLWWANTEQGDIIVSSETSSMDVLRIPHKNFHEVPPGTLLIFEQGNPVPQVIRFADNNRSTFCSLEAMYFMRSDSLYCIDQQDAQNKAHIRKIRFGVGKILGKKALAQLKRMGYESLNHIDVIPIPESGTPFGRGVHDALARQGAHLNEDAIILNPDIRRQRSFISKDQRTRELAALEKRKYLRDLFSPINDVIICDDTLIRGTTFRKLINDLRGYVQGRIHAILSLGSFVDTCPYGIAIKNPDELVTRVTGAIDPQDPTNPDIDKIKKFIGLRNNEMLLYASHEDVRRALREALKKCGIEPNGRDVCYACQGGNYPDSYPHSF